MCIYIYVCNNNQWKKETVSLKKSTEGLMGGLEGEKERGKYNYIS